MIWYQNPLLKTYLQMILKTSNQRIVQLGKTYGTNSSTFKQATAILQKSGVSQFSSTSASGFPKIDIRKVNRLVSSGKADRTELNQVLSQIAGIKIDESGNIEKLKNQGIKTVTQIRKQTKKKLVNQGEDPSEMPVKEIDRITEKLAEFSESFDTSYDIAMGRVGEKQLRSDPITRKLWGENRGGRGKLTYRDMEDIMDRLNEMIKKSKEDALSVEQKNGGNV